MSLMYDSPCEASSPFLREQGVEDHSGPLHSFPGLPGRFEAPQADGSDREFSV